MKKVVFNRFGGIDELQIINAETPSIKSNEVLVKVKAVSLNPLDWKIRKGEMKLMSGSKFPKAVGIDFSGVVVRVGAEVGGFKADDEVFGAVNAMKEGALAEFVAVPHTSVWRKPENITFSQAASIPVVGAAAYWAVEKIGQMNNSTDLLINGATGGFGMFTIQLAKQKGAKVTAVTGTEGVPFAEKWGSDEVVDYKRESILDSAKRFDAVLELSGKMTFQEAKKLMKPKSMFINPSPKPIEIVASFFLNLFSGKKHKPLLSQPNDASMNYLIAAVKKGADIEINRTFRLEQFAEAYNYAEKGGYVGKVTIEIGE